MEAEVIGAVETRGRCRPCGLVNMWRVVSQPMCQHRVGGARYDIGAERALVVGPTWSVRPEYEIRR